MIKTKQLMRGFKSGRTTNMVLRGIDLSIADGEFVAIMGRSGAGKSTLMYQISLLDNPTSGDVIIDGQVMNELNERQRARYRLENMGYIFQNYALMPELTAAENVMAPLMMQGFSKRQSRMMAQAALESLGILEQQKQLPSQLSGGEQQRVSIARAIANKPKILFADEPTANLDTMNAKNVLGILDRLHDEGQTIVMVTHERDYGRIAQRIIDMEDGKIIKQTKTKHGNHRKKKKPIKTRKKKT